MANLCCLPMCNNRSPAVTLFKIPSRKFVKKEKESWAERLECIVLACRSDEHIKNLFARDAVKMCEVHFERSDIVLMKENIVYNAATDRIIGFVDLGVDRQYNNEAPATHALQFYGRSILSNFSRPIVFYVTKNTKAFHLVSMFWEVVESLARCGFTVLALVADGASCNRKLFQLLNNYNLTVPYKCINIYQPEMPIYLISDPPHLLKTACNCVRSSRPGGARMMKYKQHFILWEHFCHVPYLFESSELRSCKLTDGHFSQKSYAKMRVCYAGQLLSGTVSSLMKSRGGEEMKMSAWFAGLTS